MSVRKPKPVFQQPVKKKDNHAEFENFKAMIERKPIAGSDLDLDKKKLLGEGQYGTVFLVTHKNSRMPMAMKQIQIGGDDEKALREMKMEVDVLAKSDSPYIVKFYGSFLQDGCVFYCMEYMNYGSWDRLYKYAVPEDILAKVAIATINGLKYLKDQLKVIHRDVKPTNILVNGEGEIKLCDFGVSGNLVQSVAKTYVGCSFYMAPERIDTTKASHEYDVRSDVWSMGISLVEIGNGEPPFEKNMGVFDLLNRIVNGTPPQLKDRFSDLSRAFIEECLIKDSKVRPFYEQLIEHPWIKKYTSETVDVAAWLQGLKIEH